MPPRTELPPPLDAVVFEFAQWLVVTGRRRSTAYNYSRAIARLLAATGASPSEQALRAANDKQPIASAALAEVVIPLFVRFAQGVAANAALPSQTRQIFAGVHASVPRDNYIYPLSVAWAAWRIFQEQLAGYEANQRRMQPRAIPLDTAIGSFTWNALKPFRVRDVDHILWEAKHVMNMWKVEEFQPIFHRLFAWGQWQQQEAAVGQPHIPIFPNAPRSNTPLTLKQLKREIDPERYAWSKTVVPEDPKT